LPWIFSVDICINLQTLTCSESKHRKYTVIGICLLQQTPMTVFVMHYGVV